MDKLYFDGKLTLLKECLNTFQTAVDFPLAKKSAEQTLLDDIMAADHPINATLYEQYSANLRKAVDRVFYEEGTPGLSDRLRANVTRFAAYKAYHATQQVRRQISKDGDMDQGRRVLHTFNRYQAAEYNTTVTRCRSAKQYDEFTQPDNLRLFPNLRWLPSRSATPRELHMAFYNRVWAKDDPFWTQNQPGNLWNCKCDWEETDDPVTNDNPTTPVRHDGLEGNPALTGEVFTDNCAYIKNAGANRKERDKVEMMCENMSRYETITNNTKLLTQTTTCYISNNTHNVIFNGYELKEYAQAMYGNKDYFWIKNEILKDMTKYIPKSVYIGYKNIDLTHNTNKRRLAFKRKLDIFAYFECTLPNGKTICLQLCRYQKSGNYSLYSVSKNVPIDIIKENVP